jgi:hypothetical protein
MKASVIIFLVCTVVTQVSQAIEYPVIVEIPMQENWHVLPDTADIAVLWFSDANALLAVTREGIKLLERNAIRFDMLSDMLPGMDYYIVDIRDRVSPDKPAGTPLLTGQFLVSVPAGSIMPSRRGLQYQRISPAGRPVSALIPPVYEGYASKTYSSVIQSFVDQVSETRIYDLLSHLVSYNTRYSRSQGCLDAVNWAASEFERWGYDVELYPHTSGMAPNVIARKQGLIDPGRIWVIGGHLDSISPQPETLAPGANDNGTGSALTMICAEILKDEYFADTVIYALWTGEEQGLFGSSHWAEWAAGQELNIQGYFNFDMIGWEDPEPEDLDVLVNNSSLEFGQDFVDVADLYTDLLHDLQLSSASASDHYPFWQNGYIAFCGIEDYWPSYPYYHTIEDTEDKVSLPFAADVTRAMVANVCNAARLNDTITFTQTTVACNSVMDIVVVDFAASETVDVSVYSDTEPSPEIVTLVETGPHKFEGVIVLTDQSPVHGDQKISVNHGDFVTAEYAGYTDTARAEVDCVPPEISGVAVSNLSAESFTVTWQTDEPADSVVIWGDLYPPFNTVSDTRLVTEHQVTLTNLDDNTDYYFFVRSSDIAGNMAEDTNSGGYYQATTLNALWSQQVSVSDPGRVANQVFPDASGYSSYVTDDFINDETWLIDQILVQGQLYNGGTSLMNAVSLHWRIYADESGLPSGYPPDNGAAHFWTLDLEPSDTGVKLVPGIQVNSEDTHVILDPPLQLPPGKWWLFFYPVMRFQPNGQYGRLSSDTNQLSTAKFINPGGSFGHGTTWNDWSVMGPVQHDAAFLIVGTASSEPTPTPTPLVTSVTITMPAHQYRPGDPCYCTVTVTNGDPEPLINHPLFLILDVYGEIFFAPSFTTDFDYYPGPWPPGTTPVDALPVFTWPDTGTSASGIVWYAAITDPTVTRIVGEWDSWEFGWE